MGAKDPPILPSFAHAEGAPQVCLEDSAQPALTPPSTTNDHSLSPCVRRIRDRQLITYSASERPEFCRNFRTSFRLAHWTGAPELQLTSKQLARCVRKPITCGRDSPPRNIHAGKERGELYRFLCTAPPSQPCVNPTVCASHGSAAGRQNAAAPEFTLQSAG